MHNVLWKRVDGSGHDACRFVQAADGWMIEGAAIFLQSGAPVRLFYRLFCDPMWSSVRATVSGWIGDRSIDISIQRKRADRWSVDGRVDTAVAGSQDIDLGFTPASNTIPLRRLGLAPGEDVETVALWLDPESWTVKPLPQTYRRVRSDAYDYTSPLHEYRATLEVDEFGAITEYPGLWTRV
jgi:hypothetical protein